RQGEIRGSLPFRRRHLSPIPALGFSDQQIEIEIGNGSTHEPIPRTECSVYVVGAAGLPFQTILIRNCASVLAEAIKAPACPENFKPNSTSTSSGASTKLRNMLATATAAGRIASSAVSRLLPIVSTTSLGCSPRVTGPATPSSTSISTLPPA